MGTKNRKFKTEVQHLLDLMVHSLYSNKEIFLRELIANAADALDKARFESLTNPDIAADWKINISVDKENKTLSIADNGIGMTEEDVIQNIGTIAKSGTKAFMKALEEKQKSEADIPELIGQFGVGFYSAFMVADKVEIITRRAGTENATSWSSDGKESYSLKEAKRDEQGTTVIVHLKDECEEYLQEWKIKQIVKKYSDFIEYPIILPVTKPGEKEGDAETIEDEVINSQKAIWLRPASEVKKEEYEAFFRHLSMFGGNYIRKIHFSAEGTAEFKALLFIPEKAPMDMFIPEPNKNSLHLYVRRVFITDECKNLLPDYLRFVKGVVDTNDLPLNVSREILQESKAIYQIQKNLVRKILGELKKMAQKDNEKYVAFYKEFGKVLKEGMHTDYENKEKIQELLLFETMNNEAGKLISLKEYVTTMPEEQKDIYFMTGESRTAIESSPHLEMLRSKGFDVIFMIDPIDEWVVQSLTEYDGKKLQAVGKGDISLDDDKETEEKIKEAEKEHKDLLEFLKNTLEENVKEVRFSKRLTDSACCLVGDQGDMSPHMEKMFKAMNQSMPKTKRILELNPNHPLIESFEALYKNEENHEKLKEFSSLLYDQALLTEGSTLPDPLRFTKKMAELMVIGIEQIKK